MPAISKPDDDQPAELASFQTSRLRRILPWAAVAVLAVLAFSSGLTYVWDHDVPWHLASGQWMLHHGEVLGHDPFSIAPEPVWVNVHWGFQVVIASVHSLAGWAGLSTLKAVLSLTLVLIPALALRRHVHPAWLILCMILMIMVAAGRIRVRPELFTMAFLAAVIVLVEQVRRGAAARRLAWIVPIMLVWVNMHGLFILGLGVLWAGALGAWADRLLKRGMTDNLASHGALVAAAAATAVCLLTPWPFDAFQHPFLLWSRVSGEEYYYTYGVSELRPTWQALGGQPLGLALLAAAAAAMLLNRKRAPISHWLWLAAFAGLAMLALRNIALLAPVCGYLLAWHGGKLIARIGLARPRLARLSPTLAVIACVVTLATAVGYATEAIYRWQGSHFQFGLGRYDGVYPDGTAEWLTKLPVRGDVFCNNFGDASTFIYHFAHGRDEPARLVFMDGRLEAHTLERFIDQNKFRQQFTSVPLAERIELPTTVRFVIIPGADSQQMYVLLRTKRFRLVHFDHIAACFEDSKWLGRLPDTDRKAQAVDDLPNRSANPDNYNEIELVNHKPKWNEYGRSYAANIEEYDRQLLPDGFVKAGPRTQMRWFALNPHDLNFDIGTMLLILGGEKETIQLTSPTPMRQRCVLLAIRYLTAAATAGVKADVSAGGALAEAYHQRSLLCDVEPSRFVPADVNSARSLFLFARYDVQSLDETPMLGLALHRLVAMKDARQLDSALGQVRNIMDRLPPFQRVNPQATYIDLWGTVLDAIDSARENLEQAACVQPATDDAKRDLMRDIRIMTDSSVGLIDGAISQLQNAAHDDDLNLLLGDLLLRTGRAKEARAAYGKAGSLQADQALRYALCDWVEGKPFTALESLDRLADAGDNALVCLYQAWLCLEIGKYDKSQAAIDRLANVAKISGRPADAYLLGVALQQAGRYQQAIEVFKNIDTADAELRGLVKRAGDRLRQQ